MDTTQAFFLGFIIGGVCLSTVWAIAITCHNEGLAQGDRNARRELKAQRGKR